MHASLAYMGFSCRAWLHIQVRYVHSNTALKSRNDSAAAARFASCIRLAVMYDAGLWYSKRRFCAIKE
jgi:hypothetical protein